MFVNFSLSRHPLFICVALFLSACGSSGSQTILSSDPEPAADRYPDIAYPVSDIPAAIAKFSGPSADPAAVAATEDSMALTTRRNGIVAAGTGYLSTGTVLVSPLVDPATAGVESEISAATCNTNPAGSGGHAGCSFPADAIRDGVLFHLGESDATDSVDDVGFQGFSADRKAVMDYQGIHMSQVRFSLPDTKTTGTGDAATETMRDYEYVGYDGLLDHSMFFVGLYRFFEEDEGASTLAHVRFENASLGLLYDDDDAMMGVQSPGVDLTGTGVMVGMESEQDSLDLFLVQGDAVIDYDSSAETIDIGMTNIQRLVDSEDSWYASDAGMGMLTWMGLPVTSSGFSQSGSGRVMEGSFYGTSDDIEVGAAFHHQGTFDGGDYQIWGSFGAELDEEAAP